MSYSAEMEIFGKLANAEGVWELARTATSEADHFGVDSEVEDFERMLGAAGRDGTAIKLFSSDTKDVMDELRTACAEAGLSYVVRYGPRSAEAPTGGYAWQPGLRNEIEFSMSDGELTVSVAAVERAARAGIDAVNSLVNAMASVNRVGKIQFEPGFSEAYEAHRAEYSDEGSSFKL